MQYCYKVVRQTDSPDVFVSLATRGPRGYQLKYRLGKKTKPISGPVFCYKDDNESGLALAFGTSMLYRPSCVLRCECEPYPGSVTRIVSPLMFDGFRSDEIVLFWNNEIPKRFQEVHVGEWLINIKNSTFMFFAKWVKPIQLIELP